MKSKLERSKPVYQFHFANVEPNAELARKANLRLAELLAMAPPGAYAEGYLELNDRCYRSVVDVESPFRSFHAEAVALEPGAAIQHSLEKMEDRIHAWRFGRGQEGAPAPASCFNRPQTPGVGAS